MNEIKRALLFIAAVLFILSCTQNNSTKNVSKQLESIENYLKDSVEIIFNTKVPHYFSWVGNYIQKKDTYIVLLDYGQMYLLDKNSKQIKDTVYFPPTRHRPYIFKILNRDTITYYLIAEDEIVLCQDENILKSIKLQKLDTTYSVYNTSGNTVIDNKNNAYFELFLIYYNQPDYIEQKSQIPSFYTINLTTLEDNLLNFHTRIKEFTHKKTLQSLHVYTTDNVNNRLLFCNDPADTIYEYSLENHTLKKHISGSKFIFYPVYFNPDTCENYFLCGSKLYDKITMISDIIYMNKYNLLCRILNYYDSTINAKYPILQIFDKNIKLIKELKIDERYSRSTDKIDEELYFKKFDKNHNRYVFKKFDFSNLH